VAALGFSLAYNVCLKLPGFLRNSPIGFAAAGGSGFHPAMVRAHCRATALSSTSGNRRRSSTCGRQFPVPVKQVTDGSSVFFGDNEHASRMGSPSKIDKE
jgi:hypothetical protein